MQQRVDSTRYRRRKEFHHPRVVHPIQKSLGIIGAKRVHLHRRLNGANDVIRECVNLCWNTGGSRQKTIDQIILDVVHAIVGVIQLCVRAVAPVQRYRLHVAQNRIHRLRGGLTPG